MNGLLREVHDVPQQPLSFNATMNECPDNPATIVSPSETVPSIQWVTCPFMCLHTRSLEHMCALAKDLTYCSVTQNEQFSRAIFCLIASYKWLQNRESVLALFYFYCWSTCRDNTLRYINEYNDDLVRGKNQVGQRRGKGKERG